MKYYLVTTPAWAGEYRAYEFDETMFKRVVEHFQEKASFRNRILDGVTNYVKVLDSLVVRDDSVGASVVVRDDFTMLILHYHEKPDDVTIDLAHLLVVATDRGE